MRLTAETDGRSDAPIERVTGKTRDSRLLALAGPRPSLTWVNACASSEAEKVILGGLRSPSARCAPGSRRACFFPRKEVIQPQVPLRLPCYDFTPITTQTLGDSLPKVGSSTSGSSSFRGVTGGVYKARERIHRGMLIRDY